MKKIITVILCAITCIFTTTSCRNQKDYTDNPYVYAGNKPAETTVVAVKKNVKLDSIDTPNGLMFKSKKFKLSEFKENNFTITVFYNKTSISVPVKWYYDDTDVTKQVYNELKKSKSDALRIWTSKKGKVENIEMMYKNSGASKTLWRRDQFPIKAISGD
jgi:hypothetical protein